MSDQYLQKTASGLERAISLAEAALNECDQNGYVYAAIDIASAIDKLRAIEASLRTQQ